MHEGADKEALKKKQLIARQKKLAAEKVTNIRHAHKELTSPWRMCACRRSARRAPKLLRRRARRTPKLLRRCAKRRQ